MAKMVGTDKIWYLFGVTLGLGVLILTLFCLILYRTCRHYKAKKASSAAKRPASSLTRARRLDPSHRSSLHKQSLYGRRSIGLTAMGYKNKKSRCPPMARSEAEHKMAIKLIVKCNISFYLPILKPHTYYYCITHFS